MKKVLEQAELLAQAMLDSEEYVGMRMAEQAVTHSTEAMDAMNDFMEKRQAVEEMLAATDLDNEALAQVTKTMEEAETRMEAHELIQQMNQRRNAFTGMMTNVNRIIRFVVTGEEEAAGSGCGGSCSSCSGCGH